MVSGMKQNSTYTNMRMSALVVILLVFFCVPSIARNAIRFSMDFSYARDVSRTGVRVSDIHPITPSEAMEWIGSGRNEALSGSNGFSPAFGFGYRYMNRLFVMDLGLGAEYRYCVNRTYGIMDASEGDVDTQQTNYIGHHYWTDRAVHTQHMGLTLPVMAGFEMKNICFMVGVKGGVDIWNISREKGSYSLQAEYERYMDWLINIPGHGIVEKDPYSMPAVNNAAMSWNVRACAEISYCFADSKGGNRNSQKMNPRYYVGAFAEYSFAGTKGAYLPLLVGVRLTALLQLPEPRQCKCLLF